MCCITSCPKRLIGAPTGQILHIRDGTPRHGKGTSHTRANRHTYYARLLKTLNKALRQIQQNHILYQILEL